MDGKNNITFFLSDAHLPTGDFAGERDRSAKLRSFLKHTGEHGSRLYIVGDLFDFWFEYHRVVPKADPRILGALAELADGGIELHYICGNHDVWLGSYLRDVVGAEIHGGAITPEIDGRKFYIAHGDGIFKKDRGYRLLKTVLRNRAAVRAFKALHPDLGVKLAKWISDSSREHPAVDSEDIKRIKELQKFATAKFTEGFDCVILGHIHQPNFVMDGDKVYVNLGDWIRHFTYGRYDGEELTLCYWRRE